MTEMLSSGIDIMLLGMGTVFVFLTILVLSTMLMSKIMTHVAQPEAEKNLIPTAYNQSNDNELVAVAAAVTALVRAEKKPL